MSDKWTDKLKEQLSDYEAPVPEDVWTGIIAGMDAKPKVVWWKRAIPYAAYPVAAALLLLVGYLVFMRPAVVKVTDTPIVAERTDQEIERTSDLMRDPTPVIDDAEEHHPTTKVISVPHDAQTSKPRSEGSEREDMTADTGMEDQVSATEDEEHPKVNERIDEDHPADDRQRSEQRTHRAGVVAVDRGGSEGHRIVITGRRQSGRKGQMAVGLYASNFASKESSTHKGFGDHYPALIQSVARGADVSYTSVKEEIQTLNSMQETKVTTEHSTPIKLGFRFSYYLTDRLAIESGVTATRLSTKVTSGTIQYRTETEYQMYLIGVPLSLKYQIWGTNSWGLYTIVGGAMESRISSRASTEYKLDGIVEQDPAVNQNIGGARLLWSLRGGVGLNYSIAPDWGVFIEPGVTYYLDRQILMDATQMSTPWVPTITIGLNLSY